MELELTKQVALCDERGNLNPDARGWTRYPLHQCNLSKNYFRKKKWNYWCFTTSELLFSVTLADLDYAGTGFIYLFDIKTKQFTEVTELIPLGKGCELGERVEDRVFFENQRMKISIEYFKKEKEWEIHFDIFCKEFQGKIDLQANLVSRIPFDHETMSVVIPWSKSRFQYTSKQNSILTEGSILLGNKMLSLESKDTMGILDFGRGVWKYSSSWNWASFSSVINGKNIGINMGAKWTDGTGFTENSILYDNKIYKITEDIVFTYDTQNYQNPWTHKTKNSDRVNLTFSPIYERKAYTNMLLIRSEVHQLFGFFHGYIRLEEGGPKIEIDQIFGWSEEHYARW